MKCLEFGIYVTIFLAFQKKLRDEINVYTEDLLKIALGMLSVSCKLL